MFISVKEITILYNYVVTKTFIDIILCYLISIEHCIVWIGSKIRIPCPLYFKTSLKKIILNNTSNKNFKTTVISGTPVEQTVVGLPFHNNYERNRQTDSAQPS